MIGGKENLHKTDSSDSSKTILAQNARQTPSVIVNIIFHVPVAHCHSSSTCPSLPTLQLPSWCRQTAELPKHPTVTRQKEKTQTPGGMAAAAGLHLQDRTHATTTGD
jgi:hypothetical protein